MIRFFRTNQAAPMAMPYNFQAPLQMQMPSVQMPSMGMGYYPPGFAVNPWWQYMQPPLGLTTQLPFVQPAQMPFVQPAQLSPVLPPRDQVVRQPLNLVISGDRIDMLACGLGPIMMSALDPVTHETIPILVQPRDVNPSQCRLHGQPQPKAPMSGYDPAPVSPVFDQPFAGDPGPTQPVADIPNGVI